MSKYLDKTGLGYLWGKIKALVPNLSKKTSAIHYGTVDGTSTSTVFTATVSGLTELVDGTTVMLKNGVVTSATGFTININGLGAKPVYSNMAAATADTTIFNVNYTMLFVYDSTRVAGGCWICYRGYNSDNNTIGYQLRTNSTTLNTLTRTRYYRLLFTSFDHQHWIPANTTWDNSATSTKTPNSNKIDPFGRIVYLSNTTSYLADAAVSATAVWDQYALNLGYSFNTTGTTLAMTLKKPVYVKCTPQTDGSATIDGTVQDLPTSEDGKIYIFLGIAYSATNIELTVNHPVYHYKDGSIKLWTGVSVPTKTSELTNDSGYITGMYIMSYGNSTWDDFIAAYNANKIVYCRASSNANPGTGTQGRMAFMAFIDFDGNGNPKGVEFQYYRSVSSHSASQQGDQVFVYKLDKTAGWSVTTREAYTKIVAGTGLTSSYSNGVLTISLS